MCRGSLYLFQRYFSTFVVLIFRLLCCLYKTWVLSRFCLAVPIWIKFRQEFIIGDHRLSALSPAVYPMKVYINYLVPVLVILVISSLKNKFICSYTSELVLLSFHCLFDFISWQFTCYTYRTHCFQCILCFPVKLIYQ